MRLARKRDKIKGCAPCKLLRNSWSTELEHTGQHKKSNVKNENAVLAKWKSLKHSESVKKVAVFGTGKHTRWLTWILNSSNGPEITSVLDDTPPVNQSFWNIIPVKTADFDPSSVDAIILSSDCIQDKLAARCRELYGQDIKLIYMRGCRLDLMQNKIVNQ